MARLNLPDSPDSVASPSSARGADAEMGDGLLREFLEAEAGDDDVVIDLTGSEAQVVVEPSGGVSWVPDDLGEPVTRAIHRALERAFEETIG